MTNQSNLTPEQRLDAMGQAIFHKHDDPALETPEVWRDIYRAVALDLLKRLDAAEARVKEIRRAWVEQDLRGFEAAIRDRPVQVKREEDNHD